MTTHLRCTCGTPVVPPADYDTVPRWVRDFYAANGMLAVLGGVCGKADSEGYWVEDSGDDDGATQLSVLRAATRREAERLERMLLPYLCLAVAGEIGHTNCVAGADKASLYSGLAEYRDATYGGYRCPCPDCDADGALRFVRYAYAIFTQCGWRTAYGGKAWGAIAEAAIIRLEARYTERGQTAPAPTAPRTSDRCPCHGRLYAGAPGSSWALRCPQKDTGPAGVTSTFCSKVEVFVDYVLDLEHNTGSCLNKGWIHIDFHTLHCFQDMKRTADPMSWAGAMWPAVAARVAARRPAPKVESATGCPCPDSDTETVSGITPKGSEYKLTATPMKGGALVTGTKSGDECDWLAIVADTMAVAKGYMDGLLAVLVAKGTSAGKAWYSNHKCHTCGKATPCTCCPTPDPVGSGSTKCVTASSKVGVCTCEDTPCTCPQTSTLKVKGCTVKLGAFNGPASGDPWPGKVGFYAIDSVSGTEKYTQVRCPSWENAKALWAELTMKLEAGKCFHPMRATPEKMMVVAFGCKGWPYVEVKA